MAKSKKKKNKSGSCFPAVILAAVAAAAAVGIILGVRRLYFPDRVYFESGELELFEGETVMYAAKTQPGLPFGSNLIYKSSDTDIAYVSQNGAVTAVSEGEAKITAEHKLNGKTGEVIVKVRKSSLGIELPEDEITMAENEERAVNAKVTATGFATPALEYKSENEKVATVNSDGIIKALDAGETVITVFDAVNQVSAEMKVTVIAVLEEISFKDSAADIYRGESYSPKVIFKPEDTSDKSVEFSVAPAAVAEISGNKVVGKSNGTACLTVTHVPTGKTAKMLINVVQKVESVTVSKNRLLITDGETANVTATVLPVTAKDRTLKWTSSDSSVATVAAAGSKTASIKGVSEGSCRIRAVSNSNPEAYAEIIVTVKADESKTIKKETYINGILVVNKTYGLPKDYHSEGGLTSDTLAAFEEMKKAAAKDGINLRIVSGYRSYQRQTELHNSYLSRNQSKEFVETYSARPGYSEHQTGLAIDVNTASDAFIGTPEQKWLEAHCVEYGFIIRYPKGKQAQTGFKYEPWHIRYLGKETAKKVSDSGLCLEEYLGITSVYSD